MLGLIEETARKAGQGVSAGRETVEGMQQIQDSFKGIESIVGLVHAVTLGTGKQVARYDKIHLFNLDLGNEHYHEDDTIEPGEKVVVLDNTPLGRIGLSICYDLRFPELYRAMGEVDLIVVPSAFTDTTGKAHWETLVRARAIENLCYVLAPAQGGYHLSGRETHGNSMIVDPWGVVLDRLPRGSGVVVAGINPTYQASLRSSLPALKHRKLHQC